MILLQEIWLLKVRAYGEEDEIFLFKSLNEAECALKAYFRLSKDLEINEAEKLIYDTEMGYFSIEKHRNPWEIK